MVREYHNIYDHINILTYPSECANGHPYFVGEVSHYVFRSLSQTFNI